MTRVSLPFRPHVPRLIAIGLLLLLLCGAFWAWWDGQYDPMELAGASDAERRIAAALERPMPVDMSFQEDPLGGAVIDFIRAVGKIEVEIDKQALTNAGIDTNIPITRTVGKGVMLKSALRLMFSEYDLTYVIENDALTITTRNAAAELQAAGPVAIVSAWIGADPPPPSESERRIAAALECPPNIDIGISFDRDPLGGGVVDFIRAIAKIEVQLDRKALTDAGIDWNLPITVNVPKGVPLKSALDQILGKHKLTYVIENEALIITTKDAADARQ